MIDRNSSHWQSAQRRLGVLEWLRPGEYQHTEEILQVLRELGISRLRTGLSWADWHDTDGKKWFDWLIPKLAQEVELLPCFTYTPPSLAIEPKTSSPPRKPKDFADFIDVMISEYGRHFEWIELWNEPNNLNDWDWRLDPDWRIFAEMVGMAAYWSKKRGKKTVLAGMCPTDPHWLNIICSRGTVKWIDAVALHGFPGTWEFSGESWPEKILKIRAVLERYQLSPELWITEVGYSTWRHDEINQVKTLIEALEAPLDRVYWYSGFDLHPHENHQDGFHEDERHYHFGMKTADGTSKLIYRVWQEGGLNGLHDLVDIVTQSGAELSRKPLVLVGGRNAAITAAKPTKNAVLITGGAGFIGTNVAERLLQQGETVLIFDNLGRPGVERNLEYLCETYGGQVLVEIADVRNAHLVRDAVHRASRIFHFAAQVAVTTSIDSPQLDFDTNVRGTLNILETLREMTDPPPLLFTSTNKVYGALEEIALKKNSHCYLPVDRRFAQGIDERHRLDFHSPYGCSKGSADQYVLDFARTYGIKAVVFRMSCIYGPHQFGNEDQGWVAHFLIQALQNHTLTLYGDGRQVRDILFVGDLLDAMFLAQNNMTRLSGKAFNIGGGAANSISLLELLQRIEALSGKACQPSFADWRQGDQRYYVTDTGLFRKMTGWHPATAIETGLARLYDWVAVHLFGSQAHRYSPVSIKKGAIRNVIIR